MTIKSLPTYAYHLIDVPGVVADNTFISFFNPVTSGKVMFAILGQINAYSVGASSTGASMAAYGISAASGGVLVDNEADPIEVYKLFSPWPTATLQVRHSNPTRTLTTGPIAHFSPPISVGVGGQAASSVASPSTPGVPFLPGEGFCYRTTAGNTNQRWNFTFIWAEDNA